MTDASLIQKFIEENYPKYESCPTITYLNDLELIVEDDFINLDEQRKKVFNACSNSIEKVKDEYYKTLRKVYEESIINFMRKTL